MTNISSMTDEQLAEALAIEVMGWKYLEVPNVAADGYSIGYSTDRGKWINYYDWQPCVDLNQAVECAEKVWAWKLGVNTNYVPSIHATAYTKAGDAWFSDGDNPARALCEAVAMAVEGEKE